MKREEIIAELRWLLDQAVVQDPAACVKLWCKPHYGAPLFSHVAAWASVDVVDQQAVVDGYKLTPTRCLEYVEHLSAKYGCEPLTKWREAGNAVVYVWGTPTGEKRVGFKRAREADLHEHFVPLSIAPLPSGMRAARWRQMTSEEIDDAGVLHTFEEKTELQCDKHGVSLAECGCKSEIERMGKVGAEAWAMLSKPTSELRGKPAQPRPPGTFETVIGQKRADLGSPVATFEAGTGTEVIHHVTPPCVICNGKGYTFTGTPQVRTACPCSPISPNSPRRTPPAKPVKLDPTAPDDIRANPDWDPTLPDGVALAIDTKTGEVTGMIEGLSEPSKCLSCGTQQPMLTGDCLHCENCEPVEPNAKVADTGTQSRPATPSPEHGPPTADPAGSAGAPKESKPTSSREHVAWYCEPNDDECRLAYCNTHGGELFLCSVCGEGEAGLEPTCPGPKLKPCPSVSPHPGVACIRGLDHASDCYGEVAGVQHTWEFTAPVKPGSYAVVLIQDGSVMEGAAGTEPSFCCLCSFSIPPLEPFWGVDATKGSHRAHDECVLGELKRVGHELSEQQLGGFKGRKEWRKRGEAMCKCGCLLNKHTDVNTQCSRCPCVRFRLTEDKPVQLVTKEMNDEAETDVRVAFATALDMDKVRKQKQAKKYHACQICTQTIAKADEWVARKGRTTRLRAHLSCADEALAKIKETATA